MLTIEGLLPKSKILRQVLFWAFVYCVLFSARIGWLYYERRQPLPF
jgi:hypothetical protein